MQEGAGVQVDRRPPLPRLQRRPEPPHVAGERAGAELHVVGEGHEGVLPQLLAERVQGHVEEAARAASRLSGQRW